MFKLKAVLPIWSAKIAGVAMGLIFVIVGVPLWFAAELLGLVLAFLACSGLLLAKFAFDVDQAFPDTVIMFGITRRVFHRLFNTTLHAAGWRRRVGPTIKELQAEIQGLQLAAHEAHRGRTQREREIRERAVEIDSLVDRVVKTNDILQKKYNRLILAISNVLVDARDPAVVEALSEITKQSALRQRLLDLDPLLVVYKSQATVEAGDVADALRERDIVVMPSWISLAGGFCNGIQSYGWHEANILLPEDEECKLSIQVLPPPNPESEVAKQQEKHAETSK